MPDRLKVGVSDRVNTALPLWMAEAGGCYARAGLAVEILTMAGGSAGATALQQGALDIMRVGLSSVVQINRGGGDVRLVASMSNVMRFTFFGSPRRIGAGLRGGTVGVSTFGSESESAAILALRQLGLGRDEVTLVECGNAGRRLAALESGAIQASAINEPVASAALDKGLPVLVDLVAQQIPWLFSSVVLRRADLASRRELLGRFLAATVEGNRLALSEPIAAKKVLAQALDLADARVLEISYDDFAKQAPLDLEPSEPGIRNVLAELGIAPTVPLSEFWDPTLLQELRQQGRI